MLAELELDAREARRVHRRRLADATSLDCPTNVRQLVVLAVKVHGTREFGGVYAGTPPCFVAYGRSE
jgi:hypothetical protein